jgi:hypothetical protein
VSLMDRIRAHHASRRCDSGCSTCGQPVGGCCGGCDNVQYAPVDSYGAPGGVPAAVPADNFAPGQITPDQGSNQSPVVDPSAFIINNHSYSTTN